MYDLLVSVFGNCGTLVTTPSLKGLDVSGQKRIGSLCVIDKVTMLQVRAVDLF